MSLLRQGLVQIYTGDGKGKTTAAFGLAARAAGHGFAVRIIQFMKEGGPESGEVISAKRLEIEVDIFGSNFIQLGETGRPMIEAGIARGLFFAETLIEKAQVDVVVLDELITALQFNLVTVEQVLHLMKKRPDSMELILTGRGAPPELLEKAHLVTEMVPIKHPYGEGVAAREGIEY